MKQLITGDQAQVVEKQPTTPCSDCPFARHSLRDWLGPLDAEAWIALAHGEGRSDCHATKAPDDSSYQCAGLAIYRANVCKSVRDDETMRLPPDREHVFATHTEFLDHHREKDKPST